jgi:hypothetical protein
VVDILKRLTILENHPVIKSALDVESLQTNLGNLVSRSEQQNFKVHLRGDPYDVDYPAISKGLETYASQIKSLQRNLDLHDKQLEQLPPDAKTLKETILLFFFVKTQN